MKKVDLSMVKIIDLDGKIVQEAGLHKAVAKIMFVHAKNLDLVDIAIKMNAGGSVAMADSHIKEIKELVKDPQNKFFAFARKAILDCLDNAEEIKNKLEDE